MKRLLLILLLWPVLAQASIYTAIWCPVKDQYGSLASQYFVCIETTGTVPYYGEQSAKFITPPCSGSGLWVSSATASVNIPNGSSVWFRVLAYEPLFDYVNYKISYLYSGYSNPVHVVGGLTPPAIGGCP